MKIYHNNKHAQFWESCKLDIIYTGDAKVGPEWTAGEVCSSFSRIYFITQGGGFITLNAETLPLEEGNIYIIPAGLTYSYYCTSQMQQLFFHVNVIHSSGLDLLQGQQHIFSQKITSKELQIMQDMYHSDKMADAFRLQGILAEVLAEYIDRFCLAEQYGREYSALVENIFRIARNPVDARNNVKLLAQQLHVSVSTLSKKFRKETGMTPSGYLNQLIINRACYLLHAEEYSIAKIAEQLGFADQFYFAKYFKRQMGVSPSVYKRQVRVG